MSTEATNAYSRATEDLLDEIRRHAEVTRAAHAARRAGGDFGPAYPLSVVRLSSALERFAESERRYAGSLPFSLADDDSYADDSYADGAGASAGGPAVARVRVTRADDYAVTDEAGVLQAGRLAYLRHRLSSTAGDARREVSDVAAAATALIEVGGGVDLSSQPGFGLLGSSVECTAL